MKLDRSGLLSNIGALVLIALAITASAHAQGPVNIKFLDSSQVEIPAPAERNAPSPSVYVEAQPTTMALITKVVIYRNDVPYATLTASPYRVQQLELGQETYNYYARVHYSGGAVIDSDEIKLTVYSPVIYRMGAPVGPYNPPGPGVDTDHTQHIQSAVNYISDPDGDPDTDDGGGTLYFPCTTPVGGGLSRYNIRDKIVIPSNVTLQGESSQYGFNCQIVWRDVRWTPPNYSPPDSARNCTDNSTHTPEPGGLTGEPMFQILGDTTRVRMKDMWLQSLSSGPHCWARNDWPRIATEDTTAIEFSASNDNDISDVIIENVSFSNFTHGILAVSTGDGEIYDIKIRSVTPFANHRQLVVDAAYAYKWDIQNFNILSMAPVQNGVDIINAGKPPSYTGDGKLKFLQLNCQGARPEGSEYCMKIEKHGGLLVRQLHTEGVDHALIVEDISKEPNPRANTDPIFLENSVATGKFYDASMNLILIGNSVAAAPETAADNLDEGRLRFYDAGIKSTVVDCGDLHLDGTDTHFGENPIIPDDDVTLEDLRMVFTHSERNRSSFFAMQPNRYYGKSHLNCPAGVPNISDINTVGGDTFDNGVLPTEPNFPYRTEATLNASLCPNAAACASALRILLGQSGTIYIDGNLQVNSTIPIPTGRQIVGSPGSKLTLVAPGSNLFEIVMAPPDRVSAISIRDLELETAQPDSTGISIISGICSRLPNGEIDPDDRDCVSAGASSDMKFSGLKIKGFTTGVYAGFRINHAPILIPMIDGISWKHIEFVDNQTAAQTHSGNASNWNMMKLDFRSNSIGAKGWFHTTGGHNSMQNIRCQGSSSADMEDCVRLRLVSTYHLSEIKRTQNVVNNLTFAESHYVTLEGIYRARQSMGTVIVRNSDFTSSVKDKARMNITGRSFITSMNNRYGYFRVQPASPDDDVSRVTSCGDSFTADPAFDGLAETHQNLYFGFETKSLVFCGNRAMPWEDAFNFGGQDADIPLVGNFYGDVAEDYVVYRDGTPTDIQSRFLIRRSNGTEERSIDWGVDGDQPLIGKLFPDTRSQIVIYRPSAGTWWINDPNTSQQFGVPWGVNCSIPVDCDIPFIGNFINESNGTTVLGNLDEIALYRPSTGAFYVINVRSGANTYALGDVTYGTQIQVGDFLGLGYDQIAQFNSSNGNWRIVDARYPLNPPVIINFGEAGDVPVAGRYLSTPVGNPCTQLGVWRPSVEKFFVKDTQVNHCLKPEQDLSWGSNNDFSNPIISNQIYPDDIPLTISTADGSRRRPVTYRPTKGAFEFSTQKGLWWVHDPFLE